MLVGKRLVDRRAGRLDHPRNIADGFHSEELDYRGTETGFEPIELPEAVGEMVLRAKDLCGLAFTGADLRALYDAASSSRAHDAYDTLLAGSVDEIVRSLGPLTLAHFESAATQLAHPLAASANANSTAPVTSIDTTSGVRVRECDAA